MAKTAGVLERPESTSAASRTKHNSSNTQRRSRRSQRTSVAPKPVASRSQSKSLSAKGEEAAARFLEHRGYKILERNWKCDAGEADIIARDPEGTLCFIEVKTRQSVEAGLPEEAITRSKQSRYERIALCYMMVTDDWDDNDSVRFDAIAICVTAPHRAMLRHHKGCFNECF